MDADPFAAELDAHRRYLLRVARLQLRDGDLAEDVVQETLVAALAGRQGFSGRSSVKTWLTGILKHKIVDAIRQRQREPIVLATFEEEIDLEEFDPMFKDKDRKSTRLNSSHPSISYAVFCLKKKKQSYNS